LLWLSFADHVLDQLALRFQVVLPHLNERQLRLMLGQEARLLGHGGVRAVARLRNSFRYAARQDWEKVAKALKPVRTAPTEDAARERFMEFGGHGC
jgi:hypothetical protein